MPQSYIWLNGRLIPDGDPHISAIDRGFTLGDGVFETLLAVGGRLFRAADHLARLELSAATIAMPLPATSIHLEQAALSLLDANRLQDAVVRITLSRGVPAERGLLPPRDPSPTVAIQAVPFAGFPYERGHDPFTAVLSNIRRNETSLLSRIKSCNYLDSVLARMEAAERGADEAILLNTAGHLACGASSNLFLVCDGALVTPSLDCGVLEGITRRAVLDLAAVLTLQHRECKILPGDLALAQEAFVTNTAVGIMPLVAVDARPIALGKPGPLTLRLQHTYGTLVRPNP